MNIEDLVKEKVNLELRLQGIGMINIYGMSVDDRVKLEMDRIETTKRLNQVNAEIFNYENTP